jgi:peptidoglycan/xylan/chitin deacetylase (PgdA/CDA1 family)
MYIGPVGLPRIGYCGTSVAHCRAPDAQIDYGSGADALKTPYGSSTERIPRPALGDIPYGGSGIYRCKVPNTVALTFDDGPNKYTKDVLDILDSFGARATFFITGINSGKGAIDDDRKPWKGLIERMFHSGHQIASHTWSHQDLNT